MALSPCGIDLSAAALKEAQEALDLIAVSGKTAIAAVNAKAVEIIAQLESFIPEIDINPSLQTKLQAVSLAPDASSSAALVAAIVAEFGPLVDDLSEILNAVSPDLAAIVDIVQETVDGGGSATDALSGDNATTLLTSAAKLKGGLNVATICEKCKNIEIKTAADGSKIAVELPDPPSIPQSAPVSEAYKPAQSLASRNAEGAAKLLLLESQNYAGAKLLREYDTYGKPPLITELEFRKQGNRFFSNYSFLYAKYASTIGVGDQPNDWPLRTNGWVPLDKARDTNYIGEPLLNEDALWDDQKEYYDNINSTGISFEDAIQLQYNLAPPDLIAKTVGTDSGLFLNPI